MIGDLAPVRGTPLQSHGNAMGKGSVGKGSVFIFFHANKPIPVFRFSTEKLSVSGPVHHYKVEISSDGKEMDGGR
jgi:hypothetical protein